MPFELGMDMWSYHNRIMKNQYTLEDYLDEVKSYQLDYVHIGRSEFNIMGVNNALLNDDLQKVKNLLDERGLGVILNDYRSLVVKGDEAHTQIEEMSKELDLAKELNAKLLKIVITTIDHKGIGGKTLEEMGREEVKNILFTNLKEVIKLAEDKKVEVALENHGWESTEEFKFFLDEINSPNFGVCLDSGNQLEIFEDPIKFAEVVAPRVKVVHFKNYGFIITPYGGKLVGSKLRGGYIDVDKIVNILKEEEQKTKRTIYFSIEVPCEDDADEKAIVESYIPYIKEQFRK